MLKKLFVHEWKDTWKIPALLNAVVLGLTLIGAVMLGNAIWDNADTNPAIAATIILYSTLYIASIIALGMVTNIYFWFRFYKNLYTDQGYLMHTLPVTTNELIWSKFFVNVIWSFISGLVQAFSVLTVLESAFHIFDDFDFQVIIEGFKDIQAESIPQVVAFIVLIIASFVMSVFMGYAAVSIGQLFKKHRVGGAILMYIALYMAFQMISSYTMIPMSRYMVNEIDSPTPIFVFEIVMLLITAVGAVAFYFITNHIMSKKLNLE